jgi:hypothetical protein
MEKDRFVQGSRRFFNGIIMGTVGNDKDSTAAGNWNDGSDGLMLLSGLVAVPVKWEEIQISSFMD